MANTNCPVCGSPAGAGACKTCGYEPGQWIGLSETQAREAEGKRIAAARLEWEIRNPPAPDGWPEHRYELKYRVEAKRSLFGQETARLLLCITSPISPPLQLPATVLVGHGTRLPTSREDGTELFRWPSVQIGAQGGLLTAPLTILRGQTWFLRLFLVHAEDAEIIRLIHAHAREMQVA